MDPLKLITCFQQFGLKCSHLLRTMIVIVTLAYVHSNVVSIPEKPIGIALLIMEVSGKTLAVIDKTAAH